MAAGQERLVAAWQERLAAVWQERPVAAWQERLVAAWQERPVAAWQERLAAAVHHKQEPRPHWAIHSCPKPEQRHSLPQAMRRPLPPLRRYRH